MLVFGGSLGARSINLAAVEAYAERRLSRAARLWPARLPRVGGAPRPPGYDLREYLDLAEFAHALAAADLVVARAGGSLFEIAAHGKPAILMPYPHASADHQSGERALDGQGGAAVVVPDGELSAARLAREMAALLADPQRMATMARRLDGWRGRMPPGRSRKSCWRRREMSALRVDGGYSGVGVRRAGRMGGARGGSQRGRGAGGACTSSAWAAPG